jgi:hypothetical protein
MINSRRFAAPKRIRDKKRRYTGETTDGSQFQ